MQLFFLCFLLLQTQLSEKEGGLLESKREEKKKTKTMLVSAVPFINEVNLHPVTHYK